MKYLKILALTAAAAMTLAASASATTLTSPAGTTYTGTLQATSSPLKFEGENFITVECQAMTIDGNVESHGATSTAGFKIRTASGLIPCSHTFTVLKLGAIEIHTDQSGVNDGNGRVTWNGFEFSVHTSFGVCNYAMVNADAGTLTGSNAGKAVWNLNSASMTKTGGGFLCDPALTMTGSFTFTTPSTLSVD